MAYLYKEINKVPGLSGNAFQRQKQYWDKLGLGSGYRGSYSQNIKLLNMLKKPNFGLSKKKKPAPKKKPVPKKKSIAEDYVPDDVAPSKDIPQFENVLSRQELINQMAPTVREQAAAEVTPELVRNYTRNYRDYMGGLAQQGGGRFGRALGNVGAMQADYNRRRGEQMQDWMNTFNTGVGTWYSGVRDQYNKARDAGNVYDVKVPTWQDFTKQQGYDPNIASQYGYSSSPFVGKPNQRGYQNTPSIPDKGNVYYAQSNYNY